MLFNEMTFLYILIINCLNRNAKSYFTICYDFFKLDRNKGSDVSDGIWLVSKTHFKKVKGNESYRALFLESHVRTNHVLWTMRNGRYEDIPSQINGLIN